MLGGEQPSARSHEVFRRLHAISLVELGRADLDSATQDHAKNYTNTAPCT